MLKVLLEMPEMCRRLQPREMAYAARHPPFPPAAQCQAEAGPAAPPRQGAAQEGSGQAGGKEEVMRSNGDGPCLSAWAPRRLLFASPALCQARYDAWQLVTPGA